MKKTHSAVPHVSDREGRVYRHWDIPGFRGQMEKRPPSYRAVEEQRGYFRLYTPAGLVLNPRQLFGFDIIISYCREIGVGLRVCDSTGREVPGIIRVDRG